MTQWTKGWLAKIAPSQKAAPRTEAKRRQANAPAPLIGALETAARGSGFWLGKGSPSDREVVKATAKLRKDYKRI